MARVRDIIEGKQPVKAHRLENSVTCQYQVIHDADGNALLHLSTFGSDNRASPSKSSQSIQLDEENAKDLMDILVRTFGLVLGGDPQLGARNLDSLSIDTSEN